MTRAHLILGVCVTALLCVGCGSYSTFPRAKVIKVDEPADLKNIIKDGKAGPDAEYLIVDVRKVKKYAQGHIPTAITLPGAKIDEEAEDAPGKDQCLIVYGDSGLASNIAGKKLVKAGYERVYSWGAYEDWPFDTEESPELIVVKEKKKKKKKKKKEKKKKAEQDEKEEEAEEADEDEPEEEEEESDDFLDGLE